ncbi:MAG: hypothetical protein DRH44_02855 [Candidatus Coatesbacteria bacterium]|nr:MAG: hypothetical protein DRH44_02855 [Candidatus Coatesbacteria bacterium]
MLSKTLFNMTPPIINYYTDPDEFTNALKGKRGFYILLVEVSKNAEIRYMKGEMSVNSGFYIYIGSAMATLSGRVSRYIRGPENIHWHIDRLLLYSKVNKIVAVPSDRRLECRVAQFIGGILGWSSGVAGFGSTDCGCPSHLFFISNKGLIEKLLKEEIWRGIDYFPEEIFCLSY